MRAPEKASVKSAYAAKEAVTCVSNQRVRRISVSGPPGFSFASAKRIARMETGTVTFSVSRSSYLNMTITLTSTVVQLKKPSVSYIDAIGACPVDQMRSRRPPVCTRRPATRSHFDAPPTGFDFDAWWINTVMRLRAYRAMAAMRNGFIFALDSGSYLKHFFQTAQKAPYARPRLNRGARNEAYSLPYAALTSFEAKKADGLIPSLREF